MLPCASIDKQDPYYLHPTELDKYSLGRSGVLDIIPTDLSFFPLRSRASMLIVMFTGDNVLAWSSVAHWIKVILVCEAGTARESS